MAVYAVSVVSATLYCSSALPRHTRLGPCRHPRPGLHTPDSIDARSDVGAGAVLHGTSRLLPRRPRCGSPAPGRAPSRYCMPTLYRSSAPRRSVRSGAPAKFQVTCATGAPPLCALERARGPHAYVHWSLAPWRPPGIACSTTLEPRSSALLCVQSLLPSIIPAFPTGQYLRVLHPLASLPSRVQVYPPPPPAKDICVASPFLTPCAVLSSGTCSQPA